MTKEQITERYGKALEANKGGATQAIGEIEVRQYAYKTYGSNRYYKRALKEIIALHKAN